MPTVLVPVDAHESRAAAQAAAVRDLPIDTAELTAIVTHVFDERQPDVDGTARPFTSPEGLASVRRAVSDLTAAGIETVVHDESGDPATDILELAETVDADWIVLGNRHRSRLSRTLRAGVTKRVREGTKRRVVVA